MAKFLWRGVGLMNTFPHYCRDVTGFAEPRPAPKDIRKKGGNYVLQAECLSENLPDIYIYIFIYKYYIFIYIMFLYIIFIYIIYIYI